MGFRIRDDSRDDMKLQKGLYVHCLGPLNEPTIGSGSHISGALLHDAGQLGYARDKATISFGDWQRAGGSPTRAHSLPRPPYPTFF